MRTFILTVLYLSIQGVVFSQPTYNQQLEKAAISIADKIKAANKKNIAVLDFENSNKQISELGSWLSGIFTTHLENNSSGSFSVKNNTDVSKAIQQIKTESGSGAFDTRSIQRLGEISGSDVVIYAIITLMDGEVIVNIKAVNPSGSGQTSIGGIIVSFLATEGMRTKYENYIEDKTLQQAGSKTATGGASSEGVGRKSKNSNCIEKNTGDYCFQNNTKFNLDITFSNPYDRACTLQPGQKQCFYDEKAGSADYKIIAWRNGKPVGFSYNAPVDYSAKGSVYIETCQEKTFIIR